MISIAIPAYDMHGVGAKMLERALKSIKIQTYTDYEIVVSDNSEGEEIKKLSMKYKAKYYRNPTKGMAINTNMAILKSKGDLIKILYQDDYLAHEDSLKLIVDHFTGDWLVSGCLHHSGFLGNPHYPAWSPTIYQGNNTIGSPSVVTIRNRNPILFDTEMTWLLDCDYYTRLFELYGEPIVINDLNVVMGLHKKQVTSILDEGVRRRELDYILKKHDTSLKAALHGQN